MDGDICNFENACIPIDILFCYIYWATWKLYFLEEEELSLWS